MKSYNGFSPEHRNRAGAWLRQQWAAGLPRPSKCCACGQTEGIFDAHAEDYSEPFMAGKTDQYPLCFTCHMMVHCRFRNRAEWNHYREMIADGFRGAPSFKRDFQTFAKNYLNGPRFLESLFTAGEPPKIFPLDEIDVWLSQNGKR